MILNKKKIKINVTELIICVLALLFVVGTRSWFAVCPVMSETVMSCHWAGEMLKVMSLLLLILSLVHLCIPEEKIKMGMDLSMAGICLVCVFIPGRIIGICQGADMACRRLTLPWTAVFCLALILVFLVDILCYGTYLSRKKHARKDKNHEILN